MDARLLPAAIDAALEALLNATVRYDARQGACLQPLVGKTVQVTFDDLGMTLYLIIQPGEIALNRTLEGEPDAVIRTHALLWPLLKQPDTRARLLDEGRAALEGDTTVAERLLDCLGSLSPDIGAFVERWLGLLPASLLEQARRPLERLGDNLRQTLRTSLKDYLQFELDLLPTRESFEVFSQQVAELAERVERLEKRIAGLEEENA
ncbi:SCP2 sterol-binding domain-containing protein [Sulfurivirga sp.]|uniref:ubiquinone biosynthesis accessory factor UbiJ n=1 Tax=Sulfurivirga sp. TaxID=2614236 RepID=UPI0025D485AF|nr:SCP2 sterol-binding domain-containing protein [Sulfurivirga sp.]